MDLVVEFLGHNSMMNRRLLEACQDLSPDQLGTTVAGTYGSIGATLVHIVNGEVAYIPRFLASEKPERLAEDPFPGFTVLAERFSYADTMLEEAARKAGESHHAEVSGDDPPGRWRMPAALMLLQAVNHGTEHRSQIATIMTQLGLEPPPMDGWTYFFDAGHMEEI